MAFGTKQQLGSGGGGGGTILGTIDVHQIGYGSALNTLAGDNSLTRIISEDRYTFAGTINPSSGIFFNGQGAPSGLGAHEGIGMDFRGGVNTYTFGAINLGNSTNLRIDDAGSSMYSSAEGFVVLGDTHGRGYVSVQPDAATRRVTIGDVDQNFNGTRFIVDDVAANYAFTSFAGGGTKMLTVNNSGVVGVQAIPGGTVTGTGAAGEVAFWTGTSSVSGDVGFQWISSSKDLSVGDLASSFNNTKFFVTDSALRIRAVVNGVFEVTDSALDPFMRLNLGTGEYSFGNSTNGLGNTTYMDMSDPNQFCLILSKYNGIVNSPFLSMNWQQGTTLVGDSNGSKNGTYIKIDDTNKAITTFNDGQTEIKNKAGTEIGFVADMGALQFGMGDLLELHNKTRFFMNDGLKILDFNNTGVTRFGDIDGSGNGTILTVDDTNNRVVVTKPFGLMGYTVATLPTGGIGQTAYVTDALTPAFGSPVVGLGAVVIPVFHNGVTWIVG